MTLNDRLAIAEAITGTGLFLDRRDWRRVQSLFAEHVTVDYTSLFGGTVSTTTAAALVQQWRDRLAPLDATQHIISNVQIAEAKGVVTGLSHVQARHIRGEQFWVVGGIYTHELAFTVQGWRVHSLTLQRLYEEGNRAVLEPSEDVPRSQARGA